MQLHFPKKVIWKLHPSPEPLNDGDLSNKELIERIINVEGLYLRLYEKEINNNEISNN